VANQEKLTSRKKTVTYPVLSFFYRMRDLRGNIHQETARPRGCPEVAVDLRSLGLARVKRGCDTGN